MLIPELPDLNEYGIFKRQTAEETVSTLCCKNKGSFIRDEKILRKTIMNTMDIIQKYFLKHPVYLKENVAFFL